MKRRMLPPHWFVMLLFLPFELAVRTPPKTKQRAFAMGMAIPVMVPWLMLMFPLIMGLLLVDICHDAMEAQ